MDSIISHYTARRDPSPTKAPQPGVGAKRKSTIAFDDERELGDGRIICLDSPKEGPSNKRPRIATESPESETTKPEPKPVPSSGNKATAIRVEENPAVAKRIQREKDRRRSSKGRVSIGSNNRRRSIAPRV